MSITWKTRHQATNVQEAMEALADYPRDEDRACEMIYGSLQYSLVEKGRVLEYAAMFGVPVKLREMMAAGARYLNENSEDYTGVDPAAGSWDGYGWMASTC